MRKKVDNPKSGDTRIVKKFLWFPKKLGDEVRWLETASIKQEYGVWAFKDGCQWNDISWAD